MIEIQMILQRNPNNFTKKSKEESDHKYSSALGQIIASMSFDILYLLIFVFELLQGTVIGGTFPNPLFKTIVWCCFFYPTVHVMV